MSLLRIHIEDDYKLRIVSLLVNLEPFLREYAIRKLITRDDVANDSKSGCIIGRQPLNGEPVDDLE